MLALSAADTGLWAALAPRSFYRSFPVQGHHWVSAMGPYNEHLVRDVGSLYLALLVISAWAVLRPREETLRLTAVAWLACGIPHLVFHMSHLDMYGTADQVGNIVTLGGIVLLALLLLLPGGRNESGKVAS
ncbi:hypothetical protein [Streptacidiphilus sp. PAMC 29251]